MTQFLCVGFILVIKNPLHFKFHLFNYENPFHYQLKSKFHTKRRNKCKKTFKKLRFRLGNKLCDNAKLYEGTCVLVL